jgi:regulator of sirC expression with transglutaminase-like and TPR domain
MEETREIAALFHLIDDPDREVFTSVSERIYSFGVPIIPNLEHLWENTPDEDVQERIEMLIHRLHFRELSEDLDLWKSTNEDDLLSGAILVSRFQYPDLAVTAVMKEIEKIRRNIWLELTNYLTSLEQANVITTILYNFYNLKGIEVSYKEPNDFLINKVLDSKKGNSVSNGILYLVMAQLLDIPVRAVRIPRQFILAFFDADTQDWDDVEENPIDHIQFFIDPTSGQIYTHKDVEAYFEKLSVPFTAEYFRPQSNARVIQTLIEQLARCFTSSADQYKHEELMQLLRLLD